MKFRKGTRRPAIEYEKDLVGYWKKNKTFEKSIANRPVDNSYIFYDGPPFISGSPHHGTLLSSIIKDVVPRYQTMKGKRVERVWGWDCHGLPAERFTEKKLGIKSREEVLEYGIEKYIIACRDSMVQTSSLWEDTVDRIGRWVDFKGAYKTMDKDYMESVWWAFKKLYEKRSIYEGEKVLMYCTLDATPLSKAEVTMDAGAYQDVTDPSVFVKFKLVDEDTSLLAWTTTPWTLLANTALAINEKIDYVEVLHATEKFILAKDLVEKVFIDEKHQLIEHKVLRTFKGSELVGREYEPLFANRGKNAHKIWHVDYVSDEDGSGIVHLAPAYGEEDFTVAQEKNIPVAHVLDENGIYTEGDWKGQNVWEVNKEIAKTLHEKGIVWKIDYIRHSYPHCHRCGTRLMYRAHPSWFMDIDIQRANMLQQNDKVEWFPHHIKNGRFAKNIEQAPDWNISRDRFWATAMPVWKGTDKDGKEHIKVVGSYEELEELSGVVLKDYHRPWIDDVTFTIDEVTYQRIDKVLDSWFEAASMPFAQFHYPFKNKAKFEANFPGDFIVEYIGQVRAWFYYMHAMSVTLFGENSFKNVIVTGNVVGSDGRKMSKSYGNYTDPNELMDQFSADSLRFLLISSPLLNGEDFTLQDKEVGDVARKLNMIWNVYDFFTLYADVDGWEWDDTASGQTKLADPTPDLSHYLDRWVVSRLHQLIQEVDKHMLLYDLPNGIKPIFPFIDDVSNWYVRRSRKRFWKSEDDTDKNDAYKTLHYVLVRLSYVLAPFTPFLAEELYRKLTNGESVHLEDWPQTGHIDERLIDKMAAVRQVIATGLAERSKASIKVRQPLQSISVSPEIYSLIADFQAIVKEELNIKQLQEDKSLTTGELVLNTKLTHTLKREGLAREVIRHVQNARKEAGLEVDDHINLVLATETKELAESIEEHSTVICGETLAIKLESAGEHDFKTTVELAHDSVLFISLERS